MTQMFPLKAHLAVQYFSKVKQSFDPRPLLRLEKSEGLMKNYKDCLRGGGGSWHRHYRP